MLEDAARGQLAITSLAEESRPPAATATTPTSDGATSAARTPSPARLRIHPIRQLAGA